MLFLRGLQNALHELPNNAVSGSLLRRCYIPMVSWLDWSNPESMIAALESAVEYDKKRFGPTQLELDLQ